MLRGMRREEARARGGGTNDERGDILVEWARRIAVGNGDTPAGLLRDLGLEGALADDFGSAVLDPPRTAWRGSDSTVACRAWRPSRSGRRLAR